MNARRVLLASPLLALLPAATLGSAPADGNRGGGPEPFVFEVTVTNLTRSQPISPILVATHDGSVAMFTPGQPAGKELVLLAEDGENGDLGNLLAQQPGAADVVSGVAPIGPGKSETVLISASPHARLLSLAGMLVNTNDAFIGVDSLVLPPRNDAARLLVPAYDAGSETNNELCRYIPGPACNSLFSRDVSGAEGYIHIHAGIHGIGDLEPETYDWRNPAALVAIRRMR